MSERVLELPRMISTGRLLRAVGTFLFLLHILGSQGWGQVRDNYERCSQEVDGDADAALHYCTAAIESGQLSDTNLRGALNNRGIAFKNKGDYERAIRDFDQAIGLNPNDTKALNNRGAAHMNRGDYERAIPDFDKAIWLDPDYDIAFKNRGVAYMNMGKGDYERAIQDYDQFIRLNPESAFSLQTRGILHFYLANFQSSEQDQMLALQADPTDPYSAIWLYLAQARSGKYAQSELASYAERVKLAGWPAPVVALYLGKATPETLLSSAKASSRPRDRECEALYYLGQRALLSGDRAEAIRLLQAAIATEARSNFEYRGAVAELSRLTAPQ